MLSDLVLIVSAMGISLLALDHVLHGVFQYQVHDIPSDTRSEK